MGEEHQQAFNEIKRRLLLPDSKGRFHLLSDTSKFARGSALYQIQNGKLKSIDYVGQKLLSSTELFYHRFRNVWFS